MPDLLPDEHLEPLGGGLRLVVSKAHIFSTDSLILAYFSAIRKNDCACDLGTGSGILPLLWCKGESGPITAVDIQEKACAQLEKTIALNALQDRIRVVKTDLRQKHPALPWGTFDLVTMNPPYQAAGSGIESAAGSDKIARHETTCTLEDAAKAAAGSAFATNRNASRTSFVHCGRKKSKPSASASSRSRRIALRGWCLWRANAAGSRGFVWSRR